MKNITLIVIALATLAGCLGTTEVELQTKIGHSQKP